MVRVLKSDRLNADVRYIEAAGLSTDDKPTSGVATGSLFQEVNTGKVYAFAEGDPGNWYMIKDGPVQTDG